MGMAGRPARARGGFSVFERRAAQADAQARREEAAREAAAKAAAAPEPEEDIELVLSGDEESEPEPEQAPEAPDPPRKSPKKEKRDTAGRRSPVREAAEQRQSVRKTAKPAAEKGAEASAAGPLRQQEQQESSAPAPALPGPGPAPAAIPAQEPRQAQPAAAEAPALEPLAPDELAAGLLPAVLALRERLADPACGSAEAMPLRPSLQEAQRSLEALLSTTVEVAGENSSVLLVGGRGVGKTLAVERAAAALEARYNTDPANPRLGFVRLSGLAHTDERAAFREVARQLCRIFACHFAKHASLEDNLEFLRDVLRELRRCHKVVVFLLDEFDLFARKPKQTLLYNLLDAMQAASMQAAVVGMSARCDVTELLEKRVKSRFSYRRRLVLEPGAQQFEDAAEGPPALLAALLRLVPRGGAGGPSAAFCAHFNAAVGEALRSEEVLATLRLLCDKGYGSPRALAGLAQWTLNAALLDNCLPQPRHLLTPMRAALEAPNSQVEAVAGCSILELFLLVAAERLRRRGQEAPNFEMAAHEYGGLRRGGGYRGVDDAASRPAAFRAFERLITAGLLAYTDPRTEDRGGLREFAPAALLVTRQELEEGLRRSSNAPSALLEWLNKDALSSHAAVME